MRKYILKSIDETDDSLAATITYEFNVEMLDDISFHLATFLRSVGFTYVDDVKIIKEHDGIDDEDYTEEVNEELEE